MRARWCASARMAAEYRYEFGSDVVVDIIGYRRHGHSEVDDPTITQPLLYEAIKQHPPLWQVYAEDIGADPASSVERIRTEYEQAQKNAGGINGPRCAICLAIGGRTRTAATSPSTK